LDNIKVIQYGVGPIGSYIVKLALEKGFEVVGAIDIDESKVGKDLGEVIGLDRTLDVTISDKPEEVFAESKADVVLHSTGSYLENVYGQLVSALKAGLNVISTCEELSYPFHKHPTLAKQLDKTAKANNVTVLGTGVNPGFVMDAMVIMMTGICKNLTKIQAYRIQDASKRRLPFQQKIGAGLSVEEFKAKVANGVIRHVGFSESVAMIADSLGWKLDKISETVDPIIATQPVKSQFINVKPGYVAGIDQKAYGLADETPVIVLNLQAYIGCRDPCEHLIIDGTPRVDLKIAGGVHGDLATSSVIINSIPRVINAAPGLATMKDLPLPHAIAGDIRHLIKK